VGGLLSHPPRPVDRFTAAPRSVCSRDIAARLACEGALSSGPEYPHSADPTYLSSSSLGLPNLCWAACLETPNAKPIDVHEWPLLRAILTCRRRLMSATFNSVSAATTRLRLLSQSSNCLPIASTMP
jgi:hypothetical protein